MPINPKSYPYSIRTERYGTGNVKAFKHTLKLFNARLAFEVSNSSRPSQLMIGRCEAGNHAVWVEGTIKDGFVHPSAPVPEIKQSVCRRATP